MDKNLFIEIQTWCCMFYPFSYQELFKRVQNVHYIILPPSLRFHRVRHFGQIIKEPANLNKWKAFSSPWPENFYFSLNFYFCNPFVINPQLKTKQTRSSVDRKSLNEELILKYTRWISLTNIWFISWSYIYTYTYPQDKI